MPKISRKLSRDKGVALLMVLVGLAVLGLVANEIRYNSVVEMRLATNQRDDLRAYYMAKSGIGLSRLMLRFQKQMDAVQIPNISGMLASLGPLLSGGAPPSAAALTSALGGGAPGAAAAPAPTMSLQLWRMAKIDCHMLQMMVPEEDPKKGGIGPSKSSKKFDFDTENPELAQAQSKRKFGGFEGCFDTVLSDEEEKMNLGRLNAGALTEKVAMMQALATFSDKKYEFLFEKEDANKEKVIPTDIVIALRDWIDDDEVGSQLNLTGPGEAFVKGFADENYSYNKYDPRYKAKNAYFDSFEELYLVHGFNDRFMAAFGDKLTVFPDKNSKMNINTDDPILLEMAIRSIADPLHPDPRLQDPVFIDTLIKKIRMARVMPMFGMGAADFINLVKAAGVPIDASIAANVQGNRVIGDKSSTYRIKVTGEAGDVTRTLTAVIRLDDGLGRILYWKEE